MKESFTREIKRKGNIIFKKYCRRKHPPCPVCGKASFLHHDYEHYSNYRCTDKKCNHSFFCMEVRCCYRSVYVNSFRQAQFQAYALSRSNYHHGFVNVLFRNISLILKTAFNIKVSHTTVSNWCVKFAPMFDDIRIQLVSLLDLNSDEWHADETVVKIARCKALYLVYHRQ